LYFGEKLLRSYGWESSDEALAKSKKRLKTLPKPIWADGSVLCDHIDVNTGKVYNLPWNSKPAVRRFAVGKKKILDLGCGPIGTIMKDGLPIRVDMRDDVNADYRCDVRILPFKTESYDVIFSSHTLEHFSREQLLKLLDEWLRILKPGGELRLILPNLEVAAKDILDGKMSMRTMHILYGEQNELWNYHKNGFTPKSIEELLKSKGMKIKKIWTEEPFNLFVEATKGEAIKSIGTGEGLLIQKEDVQQAVEDKLVAAATPSKDVAEASSKPTIPVRTGHWEDGEFKYDAEGKGAVTVMPIEDAGTLGKSLLFTSCEGAIPTVVAFGTDSEAARRWQGAEGLKFISPGNALEGVPPRLLKKVLGKARKRKR
jgi:SAM-dependent methyltransferase